MDLYEINLGKLPETIQGDMELGSDLIQRLEEYEKKNDLPSFELIEDGGEVKAIRIESSK